MVHSLNKCVADGCITEEGANVLRQAIKERANIVVCGLTSSGKTQFLNALIEEIPDTDDIAVVEMYPELNIAHPLAARRDLKNVLPEKYDLEMKKCLEELRKLNPEWMVIGEATPMELGYIVNRTDPDSISIMTTMHCGNYGMRALNRIAIGVLLEDAKITTKESREAIAKCIDYLVVMSYDNDTGKRYVSGIAKIDGLENGEYIYHDCLEEHLEE